MLTLTGSSTATSSLVDACFIPDTTTVVSISRSFPKDILQVWDATTGSQIGSDIPLNNSSVCASVSMATPSSAVIWNYGDASFDLIDINTGALTNFSGTSEQVLLSLKGQQSASNISLGITMAGARATANKVQKFDVNTQTVSSGTLPLLNSVKVNTVTTTSNDTWLIGTEQGLIVEIDSNFNIQSSFQLPTPYDYLTSSHLNITGLAYNNGVVFVTTPMNITFSISWLTKEVLNVLPGTYSQDAINGPALCVPSSGTVIGYQYSGSVDYKQNNYIAEWDISASPPKVRDIIWTSDGKDIITSGIQNSYGFVIVPTTRIWFFKVEPRYQKNQNPFIVDNYDEWGSSTTNLYYKKGRRIVIVDGKIESDITLPANGNTTYTISTGKRIIEIGYYGSGSPRRGSVSVYNT